MAGLYDFLFEGKPPPSVTSRVTESTSLPAWYQEYLRAHIAQAGALAGNQYQQYGEQRLAGLTPDQQAAFDATRSNVGSATPWLNQAGQVATNLSGIDTASSLTPYLDVSNQLSGTGVMAGGNMAANAGMSSFTGTTPGAYMSPYTEGVVNRLGELSRRNLSENLIPTLNDQFIRSGQFGSDRNYDFMGRVVRDANESLLGEQAGALERGYSQAGQMFQSDAARQLQSGSALGNIYAQGAQNFLQSGNALTSALQADAGRQLQAGQLSGDVGQRLQESGLRDAAALEAIGQTQQQQTQANLDLGYGDFLRQEQHPWTQLERSAAVMRGLPQPQQDVTRTSTGPGSIFQPSPLSQLTAGISGLYGLNQLLGKRAGGPVRMARGGGVQGALERVHGGRPRRSVGGLEAMRLANGR